MNKYTVDYFIEKFEAIPEGKWCSYMFVNDNGLRCARGHCYPSLQSHLEIRLIAESKHPLCAEDYALLKLFDTIWCSVADVNNGYDENYCQPTPKQRILAALYDIKKLNSEQGAQVSDTTKADQGTEAGEQYLDIRKSLAILPENKLEVDVKVKEAVNG